MEYNKTEFDKLTAIIAKLQGVPPGSPFDDIENCAFTYSDWMRTRQKALDRVSDLEARLNWIRSKLPVVEAFYREQVRAEEAKFKDVDPQEAFYGENLSLISVGCVIDTMQIVADFTKPLTKAELEPHQTKSDIIQALK